MADELDSLASGEVAVEGAETPPATVDEGQNVVEGQETETSTENKPEVETETEPIYQYGKDKVYKKDIPGIYAKNVRLQSRLAEAERLLKEHVDSGFKQKQLDQPVPPPKSEPKTDDNFDWQEAFLAGPGTPQFEEFKKRAGLTGGATVEDMRRVLAEERQRAQQEAQANAAKTKRTSMSEELNAWQFQYHDEMQKAGLPIPDDITLLASSKANKLLKDPSTTSDEMIEVYQAVVEREMRKRKLDKRTVLAGDKGTVDRAKKALDQAQIEGGAGAAESGNDEEARKKIRQFLSQRGPDISLD